MWPYTSMEGVSLFLGMTRSTLHSISMNSALSSAVPLWVAFNQLSTRLWTFFFNLMIIFLTSDSQLNPCVGLTGRHPATPPLHRHWLAMSQALTPVGNAFPLYHRMLLIICGINPRYHALPRLYICFSPERRTSKVTPALAFRLILFRPSRWAPDLISTCSSISLPPHTGKRGAIADYIFNAVLIGISPFLPPFARYGHRTCLTHYIVQGEGITFLEVKRRPRCSFV